MPYTVLQTDGALELHKDGCQHINHGKRTQRSWNCHDIIGTGCNNWNDVTNALEDYCNFITMQYEGAADGTMTDEQARARVIRQVDVSPCACDINKI